jgi:hypothetical protein
MSEFDVKKCAGISFEDLCGSSNGSLSMERVEAFLNKIVDIASQQANVNPTALVRVVHNGRVTWMTQEQASEYLQETGSKSNLRKDIEAALKGDLKNVRQELEILLALGHYTLEKFKENEAIPPDEIKRIEPGLQRRQYEIQEGVNQTSESEAIVNDKRRRNPVIEEFEELMGQLLKVKATGNMEAATEIAKVLALKKKNYILITRSIEPDVKTIYYHRLSLQKTKKRLLHTQNELCSTRQDSLVLELNDLKSSINLVQAQTQEAEFAGQGIAAATIDRKDLYDEEKVQEVKQVITERETELETLKHESAVIDNQVASVDAVIETISEQVLGETDSKMNVQAQLKRESMKARPKQATSNNPATKKKSMGMHRHR